jgi:hypothetical protein
MRHRNDVLPANIRILPFFESGFNGSSVELANHSTLWRDMNFFESSNRSSTSILFCIKAYVSDSGFHEAIYISLTDFLMLTEDEKRGLKTPLCRTPVSDLLQFAAQFLPVNRNCHPSNELRSHITDFVHFQASQDSSLACFPSSATDDWKTCASFEPGSKSDMTASDRLSSDRPDSGSTFGYPPMPAAAQHVSVVQERILRASSAAADSATVVAASAGSPPSAADADSVATAADDRVSGAVSSMTAVVVSSADGSAADAESACQQRSSSVLPTSTASESDFTGGSSATRVRLATPRRSRVVARFGIVSGQEAAAATTPSQS